MTWRHHLVIDCWYTPNLIDKGPIKITTLDSLLSKHLEQDERISIIKIDVEGREPEVIRGARTLISRHRPEVYVEASSKNELRKTQYELNQLGYKRLLGKWAATPVCHFSYQPTLPLVIYNFWLFFLKKVKKRKKIDLK